ncbi:MAG: carbohydrate-binding family 9-like protein [Armatimonadetes bacterium]|nr:carbohydrate-binding family 9-like protein [Armatimonadota bacterium]
MQVLIAHHIKQSPNLDGTLTDPIWQCAERSPGFVDMATGGPAILQTQTAVLWSDEHVYCGFWLEEPLPTANLTERDSLIFRENDVELFIDGGDCYYELEINALNTVYEVFFIWRDAYQRFDQKEFDVHRRKAYTFGGDFDRTPDHFWDGNHPRGTRWAFRDFDMPGLRTAVHIDGELNNPNVRSKGVTVEIAIPWASLGLLANGRSVPPKDGDTWNMFFGRFQQLAIGEKQVQAAWCLTPHGRYDTHMPEKFTPVIFRT